MAVEAAYSTFQQLEAAYQHIDLTASQLLEDHKEVAERKLPIRSSQQRLFQEGLRDWVLHSLLLSYTLEELLVSVAEFSAAFDLDYNGVIEQDELIRGFE